MPDPHSRSGVSVILTLSPTQNCPSPPDEGFFFFFGAALSTSTDAVAPFDASATSVPSLVNAPTS